jgi:hypothetical protein
VNNAFDMRVKHASFGLTAAVKYLVWIRALNGLADKALSYGSSRSTEMPSVLSSRCLPARAVRTSGPVHSSSLLASNCHPLPHVLATCRDKVP